MHVHVHVHIQCTFFTCLLTDTGEWTTPSTSGTPPTPRQGHIVAVVGNRLFVHGGMSGQQIFNDWHILNLSESLLDLLHSLIVAT